MGKNKQPHYAIEGSIAVAGLALSWLKNNLNLITDFEEVENLASSVSSTGGVYFVPAFSGLYAPYWRMDARGYYLIQKYKTISEWMFLILIQRYLWIDSIYHQSSFSSSYTRIGLLSN